MVAARPLEGRMKFSYALPHNVKGVRYVTNHHFVELEDHKSRKLHLSASGLMRHSCQACHHHWWTESNMCSFCPSCGSRDVEKTWGRIQLAFVPEQETEFVPIEDLLHAKSEDDIE